MIVSRLRARDDSIHMDTGQSKSSALFPGDAWAATRGHFLDQPSWFPQGGPVPL
jgi:hypothetical protein